jgi:hypothetical protein
MQDPKADNQCGRAPDPSPRPQARPVAEPLPWYEPPRQWALAVFPEVIPWASPGH